MLPAPEVRVSMPRSGVSTMAPGCPAPPAISSIEPPWREARLLSQPSASVYTDLKASLDHPDNAFKVAPFTVEIVDAMCQVRRAGRSGYA